MRNYLIQWIMAVVLGAPSLGHEGHSSDTKWWKGNLHTHSFWSDGGEFPEMIALKYKEMGYHFLALTDHNILSRGRKVVSIDRAEDPEDWQAYTGYLGRFGSEWVESEATGPGKVQVRLKPIEEYRAWVEEPGKFLLIEAEEITDSAENGRAIHMNASNLVEFIPPPGGETVQDVIRRSLALVEEQEQRYQRDILFHVNHLNYKWGVEAEDLAMVLGNQFFEIWNGVETDNDPGDAEHPSTDEKWDQANAIRLAELKAAPLYGIATDDTHDYHGEKTRALAGRAWVSVKAPFLTPESLIRAMKRGEFYSSTGVELEGVEFENGVLSVRIHPVDGEHYRTEIIGVVRGEESSGGQVLTEIEGTHVRYEMNGTEWYVRARVTSDAIPSVPSKEFPYKRAWTQPVGWTQE